MPAARPRASRPSVRAAARARSMRSLRDLPSSQLGFSSRPSLSVSAIVKPRERGCSCATNPRRGSTAAVRRAERVRARGPSPRARLAQPDRELQQRRLAGAVRPDERRHRPGRDLERAVAKRPRRAVALPEPGRLDRADASLMPPSRSPAAEPCRQKARPCSPRRARPPAPARSSAEATSAAPSRRPAAATGSSLATNVPTPRRPSTSPSRSSSR